MSDGMLKRVIWTLVILGVLAGLVAREVGHDPMTWAEWWVYSGILCVGMVGFLIAGSAKVN